MIPGLESALESDFGSFLPLIMMIPDLALFHWNRLHLLESAQVLESAPLLVLSPLLEPYNKQNYLAFLHFILIINKFVHNLMNIV